MAGAQEDKNMNATCCKHLARGKAASLDQETTVRTNLSRPVSLVRGLR